MSTHSEESLQDIKMSVALVFPKKRKTPTTVHPEIGTKESRDISRKVAAILAAIKRNKPHRQ